MYTNLREGWAGPGGGSTRRESQVTAQMLRKGSALLDGGTARREEGWEIRGEESKGGGGGGRRCLASHLIFKTLAFMLSKWSRGIKVLTE